MTYIEERWIEREKGQKNYFRLWKTSKPKGLVLIVSGMIEHVRRYDPFARFLNAQGYIVAAGDHRGQGQTAIKNGKLGSLGRDGFRKTLGDQKYYVDMLKKEYPSLPIFLLGHSFGSFISQKLIQQHSHRIDGLILIGSYKHPRARAFCGKLLLRVISSLTGEYYNCRMANDIAFLHANKNFENEFSKHAWICSDLEVVRKYDQDPLCGYLVSNNFLYELSDGILQLYNPEQLRQIRKDLPILILAGGADPFNQKGKLIMDLYLMYRQLGLSKVKLRIFDKMRHEVLNEVGKEEAFAMIDHFLDQAIMAQ